MNWDDLKVFLAVARCGSVRGAAELLDVSHSTVLRRLDGFEERLGVALFVRLATGYALTEAGAALRPRAERIEEDAFAFEREAAGSQEEQRGKLSVTMPEPVASLYLAPHLVRFRDANPGLTLEFVFTYDVLDLARRDADMAIRCTEAPDPTLVGRRLPRFAEATYAAPGYLDAFDLDDPDGGACWIGWREDDTPWIEGSAFPELPSRWRAPNVSAQLALCRAGFGLAQLPCFVGDRVHDLVRAPGAAVAPGFDAWILYHEDLRANPRVRLFTDFVCRVLKADADLFEGRAPRV